MEIFFSPLWLITLTFFVFKALARWLADAVSTVGSTTNSTALASAVRFPFTVAKVVPGATALLGPVTLPPPACAVVPVTELSTTICSAGVLPVFRDGLGAANAVMLIEHASTSERTIAIFFFMSIIPLS